MAFMDELEKMQDEKNKSTKAERQLKALSALVAKLLPSLEKQTGDQRDTYYKCIVCDSTKRGQGNAIIHFADCPVHQIKKLLENI